MKRNLNDLNSKLNEELKIQNSSQKRIEQLRSQILKEEENKRLRKFQKILKNALKKRSNKQKWE